MDILNKIKLFLSSFYHVRKIEQRIHYAIRHDNLIEKALNSVDCGISNNYHINHEVVVSLTTHGKRIFDVAATIESIMQGSLKPNRIVLWLGEEMRGVQLPITLLNQQKRGLEISYCKDIRSYTKLIPALRKYPDAIIITIDDDALYHYDLVEKLINEHSLYPKHIIANRIHRIELDNNGRPKKYLNWKWNYSPIDDSPLNFLTGVGGVLYPPQSLDSEVFNETVFLNICKYADDIWFYAMALKARTKIKKCFTHSEKGEDYIINDDVQDMALHVTNVGLGGKNDEQLIAVFDKYDLWEYLKK